MTDRPYPSIQQIRDAADILEALRGSELYRRTGRFLRLEADLRESEAARVAEAEAAEVQELAEHLFRISSPPGAVTFTQYAERYLSRARSLIALGYRKSESV